MSVKKHKFETLRIDIEEDIDFDLYEDIEPVYQMTSYVFKDMGTEKTLIIQHSEFEQ
jgi:O-acetylhomoserine/O-acetylserine sulfhydrylase-like pyridoxal-dependent enzyme